MKKHILLPGITFLICYNISVSQAQTKQYSNNELFSIARVWGFMKYYHPAVSQGKVNWDSVLLVTLDNAKPIQQVFSGWLTYANTVTFDTTHPITGSEPCDSIDRRNADLSWIQTNNTIPAIVKKELYRLAGNRQYIGTYYSRAESNRYSGKAEKKYPDAIFNEQYRLLDLFRAWNVIEYFYPYKYALDKKWNTVLQQFIPLFRTADRKTKYDSVLAKFTATIDDSHSDIEPAANYVLFGEYGPPFAFLYIDSVAVVTRIVDAALCDAAGITTGDVIRSVNNMPLPVIFKANSPYVPASNPSVKRREVYRYLFNGTTDKMKLSGYKKDHTPFITETGRIKRVYQNEWFHEGYPDNPLLQFDTTIQQLIYARIIGHTGYIEFSSLQPAHIDSIMQMMQQTKGLIIDLRGYTDNGALLKIFDHLFTEPVFWGKKSQPDFYAPGKFCYVDNVINKSFKYAGKQNSNAYRGKVVVLINETTQSAQELWAMIFKKIPGVTFIGSQTAGADGNMTQIPLTDGRKIIFSGLGIYYPNGQETQRIGIIPDIVIRPTVENIQQNKDPLVQRALQLIEKQ